MTVPHTLGFIHMDRPRLVIISWYRVLWWREVVRRGGRLFREFNSIMIIEKPIAMRPRRRSRTKQTSGDLSTPPPLSPRQFIPYVTIFFSSRPLVPQSLSPSAQTIAPTTSGSFFYFYFTPVNIYASS